MSNITVITVRVRISIAKSIAFSGDFGVCSATIRVTRDAKRPIRIARIPVEAVAGRSMTSSKVAIAYESM